MKIIGGRDYYDGVGQYYFDPSVCFIRKPFDLPWEDYLPPFIERNNYRDGLIFKLVLIAGELHHLLIERAVDKNYKETETFIYGVDNIKEHVKNTFKTSRYWWDGQMFNSWLNMPLDLYMDFCVEWKIVTGIVEHDDRKTFIRANTDKLKDVQFYKVMDVNTAFQKISQFVGGVLTNNKPIVVIGNESKIEKAGFDKVISFRHRKKENV